MPSFRRSRTRTRLRRRFKSRVGFRFRKRFGKRPQLRGAVRKRFISRRKRVFTRRTRTRSIARGKPKPIGPPVNYITFNSVGQFFGHINNIGDYMVGTYGIVRKDTIGSVVSTLDVDFMRAVAVKSIEAVSGYANGVTLRPYFVPKFYTRNVVIRTKLTNPCNFPITVRAYLCQARRDIPYTAANNNPLEILARGFAENQQTIGSDGNNGLYRADGTPYQSNKYTEFFKIVSSKRRVIAGGRSHMYTIRRRKPTFWNCSRFFSPTSGSEEMNLAEQIIAFRQHTMFYLFQFVTPVANLTTDDAKITQVTGKLIWENAMTCQWYRNLDNRSEFAITNFPLSNNLAPNALTGTDLGSVREPYDLEYKTATESV